MSNLLSPPRVSTSDLTYCRAAEGMVLVGEASSLPSFGRVFMDACDEGFTVVSHHTGRSVVYVVDDVQRDGEGDLVSWTLRPAKGADAHLPTLTVFND